MTKQTRPSGHTPNHPRIYMRKGRLSTMHDFESALTKFLEERLQLYRIYVPNQALLALYVHQTRLNLVERIDRVFDTQIDALCRAVRADYLPVQRGDE